MTSTQDRHFHKFFETLIKKVDFSGCKTPEDVNQRLLVKIKELESKSLQQNNDSNKNSGVE